MIVQTMAGASIKDLNIQNPFTNRIVYKTAEKAFYSFVKNYGTKLEKKYAKFPTEKQFFTVVDVFGALRKKINTPLNSLTLTSWSKKVLPYTGLTAGRVLFSLRGLIEAQNSRPEIYSIMNPEISKKRELLIESAKDTEKEKPLQNIEKITRNIATGAAIITAGILVNKLIANKKPQKKG